MMIARLAVMAGVALTAPAMAADTKAADRVLAPMVACRAITATQDRAACYDSALDRLRQAVASDQVTILDREQVQANRRAAFGYAGVDATQPQPAKRAAAKAAKAEAAPIEAVEEVDTTVVSAAPYTGDRWTITLADGATWRTTEGGMAVAPRAGTPVHIKRGLMNSYRMRIGNARAMSVVRVR
jgi:hypothetical protein